MISEYPLTKSNRIRLAREFRNHQRVDLSIDCILEDQMGRAYTDDPDRPTVFKLQIGSFCCLAGAAASPAGRELLQSIPPYTFLMPSPLDWIEAARELHGERLELFPRTSFSAGRLSLERLGSLLARSAYKDRIEQLDTALAEQIWRGENHNLDISDFESGQDFIARGIGYCLRADGKIVGAAYSSLVCSRGIEVSLYVEPEQRRKGVATALSCRLLSYCLERGMEPHWDAANIESCDLAEKLGYIRTGSYAAYYWIED